MPYTLITPWLNQTYGIDDTNRFSPYARLAGKQFNGGSVDGNIPVSLTDIPRGVSLLINGTTVTESQTPSQDDLAAASFYYLGGHEYTISDYEANVLINAGYGDYVTPV
jgi:hypothetical protein